MLCAYSCIKSLGCHDASDVTVIAVSKWGVAGNDDSVAFVITETEVTDCPPEAAVRPHSGGNAFEFSRLLPNVPFLIVM
jgi:hypothetical protein